MTFCEQLIVANWLKATGDEFMFYPVGSGVSARSYKYDKWLLNFGALRIYKKCSIPIWYWSWCSEYDRTLQYIKIATTYVHILNENLMININCRP